MGEEGRFESEKGKVLSWDVDTHCRAAAIRSLERFDAGGRMRRLEDERTDHHIGSASTVQLL